jgi:hypothetical protein
MWKLCAMNHCNFSDNSLVMIDNKVANDAEVEHRKPSQELWLSFWLDIMSVLGRHFL